MVRYIYIIFNIIASFEDFAYLFQHDTTFLVLGKIHLQQNNIRAAIETFRHGVATFPEHPELSTTLGLLYMQVSILCLVLTKF